MNPFKLKDSEKRAVEGITLEQIRVERARAEAQILNIIEGFKRDTGLTVVEISVEMLTTMSFGLTREQRLITGVRLKLEDV